MLAPVLAPAPAPAPTSGRSTRSTVDLTAQSVAQSFGAGQAFNTQTGKAMIIKGNETSGKSKLIEAMGYTKDTIESHIVKIMGAKPRMDQSDPSWVPPPWFDVNKIKNPELKARWLASDGKEISGLLDETECAQEALLDDLTAEQKENIIDSLTTRQVKRSGIDKSRVVARGDLMEEGVHYERSHSPTLMHVSLRFLMVLAASLGLMIIGGDFTQAFTNAVLPESEWYYMWPPKSARQYDEQGRRLVWLVKKSLYGGKNSGRNWYMLLRKYLLDQGFKQCFCEPCVFFKKTAKGMIIIGAYVDDLVTLYSDEEEMRALYAEIGSQFLFTPQEPLVDICGIEVKESQHDIILTLERYITKSAKTFLDQAQMDTKYHTPADDTLEDMVEAALARGPDSVDPALRTKYQRIVGVELYAVTTVRADASWSVAMLARAMHSPTPDLYAAAERVLIYLYGTRQIGIRYVKNRPLSISGMTDATWQVRCSTSGYAFYVADCLVSYLSKKQPTIAMCSAQSEMYALSLGALEASFLAEMTEFVTGKSVKPVGIQVDCKAIEDLAKDFVSNSRVRHFERRQLKVRELVEAGIVAISRVHTDSNVADIFTKALGRAKFEKFRKMLLNM